MIREGELVDGRFLIRSIAGIGGMGAVYQADDRKTGGQVALKVLSTPSSVDEARFLREAEVLADFSHPAIVRYVAHGVIPNTGPFLAMEWLDGEDLSIRLVRGDLAIRDSLIIIQRAAEALAEAHKRNILHRDIKPSNLFLVEGQPKQTKVVDFGLARAALPSQAMTQTGAVIGTLGYMSPEQARGETIVAAYTDVFALGCVFFECLTGKCPFAADDVVAVLVKILSGESPDIRELRPNIPEDIAELVGQMMSKAPKDRPQNASEVLEALGKLGKQPTIPSPSRSPIPRSISRGEQRLLSVILLSEGDDEGQYSKETLTPEQMKTSLSPLRKIVEPMGGEVSHLANGAVLVLLKSLSRATDQASRAAQCALSVSRAMPGCFVTLAMGAAEVTGQWPAGQVIDRAAMLLKQAIAHKSDSVLIDEVTSGLLDVRYEIRHEDRLHFLVGEQGPSGARRLLGRPTPCVGRAKELAFLDGLFNECISEPIAGVVLVTGLAGVGKSRLGLEFVSRIRASGSAQVLSTRGDPVYAGSPFALASQLIRQAAQVHAGDDSSAQHLSLRNYLSGLFADKDLVRVAEFIGELIQAPTDEPSPQLRAARNDERIKSEQLKRAFIDWLTVLCKRSPVLVSIEDLQWGDAPSIGLIDSALRQLEEEPLVILALARPEVHEIFPRLWAGSDVQGLQLGALRRKAAERLVSSVLGEDLSNTITERIVNQARGNAFYLEELIRHVAEGGDSNFPETVLAIAQSRLEGLSSDIRRVLRAASVFGEILWEEAVRKLLGDIVGTKDLTRIVDNLIDREILEPSSGEKFPGQREISFRHNLFREAAYSMLTERDRKVGHRLAAEWLEEAGERDDLVLADHYEKGGNSERAVPHFIGAAQKAFDGGNLDAALDIADRGLSNEPAGEDRGALRLLQMNGQAFRHEFSEVSKTAAEALELLPEGGTRWFRALSGLAAAGTWGGEAMAMMQALQTLQTFQGELKDIGPLGVAGSTLSDSLIHIGQRAQSQTLYQRLEEVVAEADHVDPVFLGWVRISRITRAILGLANIGDALPNAEAAVANFKEAGDQVGGSIAGGTLGWAQLHLGMLDQSLETCHEAVGFSKELNIPLSEGFAALFMGIAQVLKGNADKAIEVVEPQLAASNPLLAAYARAEIAHARLHLGELEEAEKQAQLAVNSSLLFPIAHGHALVVLASAMSELGKFEEASNHCDKALKLCETAGMDRYVQSVLRKTYAIVLDAMGQTDASRGTIEEARTFLFDQAKTLHTPELCRSYLYNLPPNAEIIELAEKWIGPAEPPISSICQE